MRKLYQKRQTNEIMEINNFKASIFEALETLSPDQADQVLRYIRVLKCSAIAEANYQQFRQNAMRQISEALSEGKAEEEFKLQLV